MRAAAVARRVGTAVTLLCFGAIHAAAPAGGVWNFRALLDGTPIGSHRFSVTAQGDERSVVSEASFTIKVLGITAYRYRHEATEQWRGDCLTALKSTTDDDGKRESVRAQQDGDAFAIQGLGPAQAVSGCVMSFAYWNPAIRTQARLLNAQTGQLEPVQVSRVGSGSVQVHGQPVAATRFRITGPAAPIEVWYTPQGEWVGLDSTVAGGRKLSYRLP